MKNLTKFLKKNKKILNEISIVINIFFLGILFFEFFFPENLVLINIQIFFLQILCLDMLRDIWETCVEIA